MSDSPDDRSPVAKAFEQGTHVTTIALMMVVPAVPGYWLDRYLQTVPAFTILGLALGMAASIWQLIRFVNRPDSDSSDQRESDNGG